MLTDSIMCGSPSVQIWVHAVHCMNLISFQPALLTTSTALHAPNILPLSLHCIALHYTQLHTPSFLPSFIPACTALHFSPLSLTILLPFLLLEASNPSFPQEQQGQEQQEQEMSSFLAWLPPRQKERRKMQQHSKEPLTRFWKSSSILIPKIEFALLRLCVTGQAKMRLQAKHFNKSHLLGANPVFFGRRSKETELNI